MKMTRELVKSETRQLLEASGWYEGRSVEIPESSFDQIPSAFSAKQEAIRFKREFSGLKIASRLYPPCINPTTGDFIPSGVEWIYISPDGTQLGAVERTLIRHRLVNVSLAGIGEVPCLELMNNGMLIYRMLSSGSIICEDPDCEVTFLIGPNWWQALDTLLLQPQKFGPDSREPIWIE